MELAFTRGSRRIDAARAMVAVIALLRRPVSRLTMVGSMSLDTRQWRIAANNLETVFRTELDADRRRLAQSRQPENGRGSCEIDADELVLQVLTAVLTDANHREASDTGHNDAAFIRQRP
jgi:hypothetical protein